MTEVHVVTKGSYSDYEIIGVFADQGEAQSVCNHYNQHDKYENWRVESMPLIEGEQVPVLELVLYFSYWPGRMYHGYDSAISENESIKPHFPFEGEQVKTCEVEGSHQSGFTVRGTDHERVRKVYSERRAELIARVNGLA